MSIDEKIFQENLYKYEQMMSDVYGEILKELGENASSGEEVVGTLIMLQCVTVRSMKLCSILLHTNIHNIKKLFIDEIDKWITLGEQNGIKL